MVVTEEFTTYLINFIERPCPAFGGLPVCPFAKHAREHGKIKFVVGPFPEVPDLNFDPEGVLIFVHPDKTFPFKVLQDVIEKFDREFPEYVFFGGHPLDTLTINGIYVRQDPYSNVQVVRRDFLRQKAAGLLKTRYYDGWSADLRRGYEF